MKTVCGVKVYENIEEALWKEPLFQILNNLVVKKQEIKGDKNEQV